MCKRADKSYIQEPMEFKDLIDTTKLIQKFLPKQADIDKILDIIKKKSPERHTSAHHNQRDSSWIPY